MILDSSLGYKGRHNEHKSMQTLTLYFQSSQKLSKTYK